MFSHGKIKTRPVQIGQIHLHKSTVSPWSRIARGFSGVLRTTAQCVSLPFCLWKSKECSGNLGLWQTASPHRGQPAPGDKKTLQNQGCEWQFKNNFKTILDIKVTWRPTTLIQRWKKKESRSEKCPARSYIRREANGNRIPGLPAQPLSLQERSRMETTPGRGQRPFQAPGRRKTQNSSNYQYFKLWIKGNKSILTHSWVCKKKSKHSPVPKSQRKENQAVVGSREWAQTVRCFKCSALHLCTDWSCVQDGAGGGGADTQPHSCRWGPQKTACQ